MNDRQYVDPDTGEVVRIGQHIAPARPVPPPVETPSLPMHSASISELTKALVQAQAAFLPIRRASTAMATATRSYQYAPLEDIIASTKEGLSKAGLVISQTTHPAPRGAVLVTMLQHTSGEWKASYWPLSAVGKPQDQGSELTYARRYQRCAILDIQPEDADDDGAAASKEQVKRETRTQTPAPRPAAAKPVAPRRPVSQEDADFVEQMDRDAAERREAEGAQAAPFAAGSEPVSPPPDGMGEFVGVPDKVETMEKNGKKSYRVYFGGEYFGTFSESSAKLAMDLATNKAGVRIIYRTKLIGASKTPYRVIEEMRPV